MAERENLKEVYMKAAKRIRKGLFAFLSIVVLTCVVFSSESFSEDTVTVIKLKVPDTLSGYKEEAFDRVWNAAMDTLDELGFVIAFASKEDGYISTDRKEEVLQEEDYRRATAFRIKAGIRLNRKGDILEVKVVLHKQYLKYSDIPGLVHWSDSPPGYFRFLSNVREEVKARADGVISNLRSNVEKALEDKESGTKPTAPSGDLR